MPKPHFRTEFFFQRFLENVLWPLRVCSRYLNDTVSLDFFFNKTSRPSDTAIKSHVRQSEKTQVPNFDLYLSSQQREFLKKWNSKSGWNILTKSVLLSETFGEMTLENFLWTSQEFSKHLRSLVSLPPCVSKTIVTIQHKNKKY